MTVAIILTQDNRNYVQNYYVTNGQPDDAPRTGDLYTTYGESKGYSDGAVMIPLRKANDANGNARYVLNAAILFADEFATAHDYLIVLPQMDNSDPSFPGAYVPPPG